MVSPGDVADRLLERLEDAASLEQPKACRSLVLDIAAELLQKDRNRRLAVERGVVSSLVALIEQFRASSEQLSGSQARKRKGSPSSCSLPPAKADIGSFDGVTLSVASKTSFPAASAGNSKIDASSTGNTVATSGGGNAPPSDHVARIQLITACLEMILGLKAFVRLDSDEVPICVLLRAHGVRVIVTAMIAHWNLKNRTLPLLNQSLRIVCNVASCDQGVRMLLEADAHKFLISLLEKDRISNIVTLRLMFNSLSKFSRFHVGARKFLENYVEAFLRIAATIPQVDFSLHLEIASLLCMISTTSKGAMAILSNDGALGYAVGVLHMSSTLASQSSGGQLEEQEKSDMLLAQALNAQENGSDHDGEEDSATVADDSPDSAPNETSMDSLNNTARNAVSAGSMLFNNLIRRQTNMNKNNQQQQGKKEEEPPSNQIIAPKLATWTAMFLHNLCYAKKTDVQMRMVISQAYETGNAALNDKLANPLHNRIFSSMKRICEMPVSSEEKAKEDLLGIGDELRLALSGRTIMEQLVDRICSEEHSQEIANEEDRCARSVLYNLDYLYACHKCEEVSLESVLRALLQKFVAHHSTVLPLSPECLNVVSFFFLVLFHPLFQRRLDLEPKTLGIIAGNDISFCEALRSLDIPEYTNLLERCLQTAIEEDTGKLRLIPLLPYRAFRARPKAAPITMKRLSSVEPHEASSEKSTDTAEGMERARDPSETSLDGKLSSSFPGMDTEDLQDSRPRRATVTASVRSLGRRRNKTRRASNPYQPSHSNLILSPLLHGGAGGSFEEDVNPRAMDEEAELSLAEWDDNADAIAVQMSLRLERMYMVTDACKIILIAFLPNDRAKKVCPAELRFLAEYEKLVYFFKRQVLAGSTSSVRAKICECIIDIAICAAGPALRNAALTVACLEALGSTPIRRLELTWRNVATSKWQAFDELKKLCGISDTHATQQAPILAGRTTSGEGEGANSGELPSIDIASRPKRNSVEPTVFLSSSRVPYVFGIVHALRSATLTDDAKVEGGQEKVKTLQEEENFVVEEEGEEGNGAILEEELIGDEINESKLSRHNRKGSGDFDPLGIFSTGSTVDGLHGTSAKKQHDGVTNAEEDEERLSVSSPFEMEEEQMDARPIDFVELDLFYNILALWITTVRRNGDWCPRLYSHEPHVQLQIMLKALPPRPPTHSVDRQMEEISLRCEPPWSLDQMLLESLYAIEGWIESLFESESEEEGKVMKAFRARLRNNKEATATTIVAALSPSSSGSSHEDLGAGAQGLGSFAGDDVVSSSATKGSAAASRIRALAENAAMWGTSVRGNGRGRSQSQLDSLARVPAAATGKLINSLIRKVSVARRERLLEESGSRSAEHWDKIMDHVRLCVERIVLAPVLSRLQLAALREHTAQECALQERVLILRSIPRERLALLLGLPTRKELPKASWHGAVATLKSIDDVDMPSLKVKILLRLKDQIYQEAARHGVTDMNADEFLPVMTYIIVQAELQHAYATTMLLRELLTDDVVSGESAYYLTTFEIALGHLLSMELPEDLLNFDILSSIAQ